MYMTSGYKWTDGSAYHYKNWGPGEPNDYMGTDDCVEYSKSARTWNDNNCYIAKNFVCKLALGYFTSCLHKNPDKNLIFLYFPGKHMLMSEAFLLQINTITNNSWRSKKNC